MLFTSYCLLCRHRNRRNASEFIGVDSGEKNYILSIFQLNVLLQKCGIQSIQNVRCSWQNACCPYTATTKRHFCLQKVPKPLVPSLKLMELNVEFKPSIFCFCNVCMIGIMVDNYLGKYCMLTTSSVV